MVAVGLTIANNCAGTSKLALITFAIERNFQIFPIREREEREERDISKQYNPPPSLHPFSPFPNLSNRIGKN